MGIRREEVISHPFSENFSSDGSTSSEREFDSSSHDSDSISSSSILCSSDSANCIVHHVSKLDTLAGLAIKYGVEIADIKRMNNLVSDLQMFAHKSLLIPIPGYHTLSPLHYSLTNSKNRNRLPPKVFTKKPNSASVYTSKSKTPPHKTSSAMSTLQSYYGLLPQKPDALKEQCTELALFSETEFSTISNRSSGFQNRNERHIYSRRSKKSDADAAYDFTTPEIGEFKQFFIRNTGSEDSLTHPLLVKGINFVRKSASASGLRLRF